MLNAPSTEPVTKGDIDNINNAPETIKDNPQQNADNGTENKIEKDNVLTKSYNDLMNRMDNLYKDDDENNEDEENSIK